MYFYKEVMESKRRRQQMDDIAEILGKHYDSSRYLRRNRSYKLYDFVSEPKSKQNNRGYVVSKNVAKRMKTYKMDPKVRQQIRRNSKQFRQNNKNKKKKKGIIIGATSLLLAGIIGVTGFFVGRLLKNATKKSKDSTSASQSADVLGTGSLDLLGVELPKTEKNSEFTKVSGDFNIEDVVRGADGLLYVDAESAANAAKSGTSEIDTQGGTLVVGGDGRVYTTEQGYEIVDEDGRVIESGDGTPESYESGVDYVVCPCDYYDDAGNLVHSAGEYITPQELERCRQYYHTTKPQGDEYVTVEEEIIYYDEETTSTGSSEEEEEEVTSTGSSEEEEEEATSTGSSEEEEEVTSTESSEEEYTQEEEVSSYSNEGIVNPDGTYTIYGVTYASYADYQQYIMDGGSGYGYVDGMIQPIGDYEIENQYTL